jgi:hypothetical protein
MVREARLPRSVRRRPEMKAVLLALADRCGHDGCDARPSVKTIAAEAEIGEKIAQVCLKGLRDLGLISEQAPPKRHRPRTWRLNLSAIRALLAPHNDAALPKVDPHDLAALTPVGPHECEVGPQVSELGPQILKLGPHAGAEEQSFEPSSLNSPLNGEFSLSKKKENDDERDEQLRGEMLAELRKKFGKRSQQLAEELLGGEASMGASHKTEYGA